MKASKKFNFIFFNCTLYILLCSSLSYAQGTWTQKANVFTTPRAGVVGFSIGNKGYMGTGWQFSNNIYYNDFWEWDQGTSAWTQKANFPGTARGNAAGFSVSNKGYIVTGTISIGTATNELWEWNQATNTWSQKAAFPGLTRAWAAAFSIGLKGYVGFGRHGNILSDFWEYYQLTDTWTQKSNIPIGVDACIAISIGNMGYVCAGRDTLFNYTDDLWEYNPILDSWTQKSNFPGGPRVNASGFSIGNKGYIGTGWDGFFVKSDFWCYDPAINLWTQKTDYPHLVFDLAHPGFSIGCKGYFGTGASSPYSTATYYNDFWEYEPDTCSLTGIDESGAGHSVLEVFPNPFSEKINININSHELAEIIIYDMNSKKVFCKNFTNTVFINTKSFAKGIYIYEVKNKNGYLKRGKIFKD